MGTLIDPYNRVIDYMRISVTDRCNLKCIYCMPENTAYIPEEDILTDEEILRIVTEAAFLGIRFIKITGGEPLMRQGVPALIKKLKDKTGIEKVTLTTNGVLLSEHLSDLCSAGIDGITISLDTLDPLSFQATTGYNRLDKIIKALHESVERNIKVKVNTVFLEDKEKEKWMKIVLLAETLPIDVRFVEMMPIAYGSSFKTVSSDIILNKLKTIYPEIKTSEKRGAGPAVYYTIPNFKGKIGFISAMSHSFCGDCNRIRLTAEGAIKPCLSYSDEISLKAILRDKTKSREDIRKAILSAVAMKPLSHCFADTHHQVAGKLFEKRSMSTFGG